MTDPREPRPEKMHPLQAMMDGWSAASQRERSGTQLTLGQLITLLEALPADRQVRGLGELMSYRGYYCDLSFEPGTEVESAGSLLARCRAAMGKVFEGYKGGDYQMGERTPLWVSPYGSGGGDKLMGLSTDGEIIVPILEPETYD